MPRIAWATDLHLGHAIPGVRARFVHDVQQAAPDLLLLTGDTATAPTIVRALEEMAGYVQCPVDAVLGNHDFYAGGIVRTRDAVREVAARVPTLRYLPDAGAHRLSARTVLVGIDGWGDALAGAPQCMVALKDEIHIDDLQRLPPLVLRYTLERLGRDEAAQLKALLEAARDDIVATQREAASLRARLRRAVAWATQAVRHLARRGPPPAHASSAADGRPLILVAIHVPPLPDATWHEGKRSPAEWVARMCNYAAGVVLMDFFADHPAFDGLVLCGHTHSPGIIHPLDNLTVRTGGAEYGDPRIQDILDVP